MMSFEARTYRFVISLTVLAAWVKLARPTGKQAGPVIVLRHPASQVVFSLLPRFTVGEQRPVHDIPRHFGIVLVAILVSWTGLALRAQGTISVTIPTRLAAGPDYATEVLGDPWDMCNPEDISPDPDERIGFSSFSFLTGPVQGRWNDDGRQRHRRRFKPVDAAPGDLWTGHQSRTERAKFSHRHRQVSGLVVQTELDRD